MNCSRLIDAVTNVLSNLELFREMGRVCLNVVLFLIIGNSGDFIKLGNISKLFAKAVLTVKYIVNLESTLSHTANGYLPQYHNYTKHFCLSKCRGD